jgi:hypothetical protein
MSGRLAIGLAAGAMLSALPADAAEVTVGAGLAVAADLSDRVSAEHTDFGPGPSLQVPVRVALSEHVSFRATGRADLGFGSDRVSWGQVVNGTPVRFYDDDHWAMLAALALTGGVEVELPGALPVTPYLGAELGAAWVGTYHSLGGETQLLLDPAENDLQNPSNIDPYTNQSAVLTDLHAGLSRGFSSRLGGWVEGGYSVAFLSARTLQKAPTDLEARREAYGWNALRLGVGMCVAL